MVTRGENHGHVRTVTVVFVILISSTVAGVGMISPALGETDATAQPTPNTTIIVDDDGGPTADYTTIQAAVDNASAGDTIHVRDGTYEGGIRIEKSLSLLGDPGGANVGPGSAAPIIDGNQQAGTAITLAAGISDVTIAGFEIRNYVGNPARGINATSTPTSNVTIRDNYIHDLAFPNGFSGSGIVAFAQDNYHTNWTVTSNRIVNTSARGISLGNVRRATISDNILVGSKNILGLTETSLNGITVATARLNQVGGTAGPLTSQNVHIVNNTIRGTYNDTGVATALNLWAFGGGATGTLRDVTVRDNRINGSIGDRGINIYARGNRTVGSVGRIESVTVANNSVAGAGSNAVGIAGEVGPLARINDITVTDNRFSDSRTGVSIFTGDTYQVREIEIAENRIANVRQAVSIQSRNRAEVTRLSVTRNDVTNTAHDSLTFNARGNATLTNVTVRANQVRRGKAGITIRARGNGTIRTVTATNNTIDQSQFGVFVNARDRGTLTNVTLTGNTLLDNEDDGIAVPREDQAQLGWITIEQNTIQTSGDDGIDLLGDSRESHGRIIVHDNRIINNSNRGLSVGSTWSASEILATQNVFVDNVAFGVANFGSGTLNATRNWWGASSGPSSPGNSVADPVTGTLANGTGDEVSARVRFDPWLTTNPRGGPGDVTGDGNPARDPDADGLYEDVNGDGDVTPGDATVLFNAVFESNPAVTENAESFDFNNDGSVTPGDATVLFNSIF